MKHCRTAVRSFTWLLIAAATLFLPPVVHADQTAATSRAAVSGIRIDNFGQVDATYYRGAQPKGHDYEDLARLGVKTLISLTSNDADPTEEAMAKRTGLKYFAIPMTTRVAPSATQLEQFLKILADPVYLPVYVHCVGGRHRTGVMTTAYRMTHDGWTADRAFGEMKQYGFGADFLHPEFKAFVLGYRAPAAAPAAIVATKPEG